MPSELAGLWALDPEIRFLNHGSFGACPRAVLEEQQAHRDALEAEPVRFMVRELPGLMADARTRLAQFVGAPAADLAFVSNATSGVNTVLRSLRFEPGDELLTTSHDYNACRNTLSFVAERWGARVVVAELPFPARDPQQIAEAVLGARSDRTRLCLLDHVTSPTGLILPVEEIAPALEAAGVPVLIDGAHAPGMVPLDLATLGASYYTGNCHKWLCAPKGAAFLYVREDRQPGIHPLTISHGYSGSWDPAQTPFRAEFDWTGTDDPSAWLAVPAAIDFLRSLLPGGWEALRQRNHALTLEARALLAERLGAALPCPDEMVPFLAAISLPGAPDPQDEMRRLLLEENIEALLLPFAGGTLLRISVQAYNSLDDYARLADALVAGR